MLPDGAERQLEDWTIFFLNQTSFNQISPVLALESEEEGSSDTEGNGKENADDEDEERELLYVLNLVRTKHDSRVRRYVNLSSEFSIGSSILATMRSFHPTVALS